jgi:hypothetical protein
MRSFNEMRYSRMAHRKLGSCHWLPVRSDRLSDEHTDVASSATDVKHAHPGVGRIVAVVRPRAVSNSQ